MASHIIGIRGPHEGQEIALSEATLTFGRTPDNTLIIDDKKTSRRHAEIRADGPNFVLQDLGSSNGTFVNKQRVQAPSVARGRRDRNRQRGVPLRGRC